MTFIECTIQALRRLLPHPLGLLVTITLLVLPRASWAVAEGISCPPEPTDMTIAYGDLVICQIDPIGDTDVFRFSASAGETVSINAARQSGSGSSWIELFDPEGTRIGWHFFRIDARLAKTGIHTIRVSEYGGSDTLAYALSLERIGPPSPAATSIHFAQGLTDEINPVGDVDVYKFDGEAGDTVTVSLSRQSGSGSSWIELFDPEGTRIGWHFFRIDARLAKTGIHTIRVSEYGGSDTLAYRIDLQCVGQCPSLASSTMTITLTGCTACRAGDVFSARASVSNPTSPTPRWLEVKSGVFLPDRTPVNLLGNPHLDLPPGFTFDGEVFRMTLPTGLPTGTYQFCGLLLERELGESVAKSCQTFTIGP